MKTLFERLSKENQEKLTEHYKDYKSTWESISKELDGNYKTKLSMLVATDIYDAIYPLEAFRVLKFYELFKD